MAKKRPHTDQNPKATSRPEAPVGEVGESPHALRKSFKQDAGPVEVDSYVDVDATQRADDDPGRPRFGPRAIDPALIVPPLDGGMNIAAVLIESLVIRLADAAVVLSQMGRYGGELHAGEGLLQDWAVVLGVEDYGDEESRERGQPMGVPWGHVLAVRGLLGHFSPTLEDRGDWPEPVVATRGLTCADILLGPLPTEFGYTRSTKLLDWARHAVANPPTVVGFDSDTVEEEFHKPYRLTVLTAVRFHLARLIAWVDGRKGEFEDLVVPVLTLTNTGVEVRIGRVRHVRSLGDLVEPFLAALLDEGKARAVAKTKFDLTAKVPELRPFITVAKKRDRAGMTVYRLADIVRRKAGSV
jgi:hypothetical protein